jgi:hypothetical protein
MHTTQDREAQEQTGRQQYIQQLNDADANANAEGEQPHTPTHAHAMRVPLTNSGYKSDALTGSGTKYSEGFEYREDGILDEE